MDDTGHSVAPGPGSDRAAHADRPWPSRGRIAAVAVGAAAGLAAIGLAAAGCLSAVGSSDSAPTSAELITVTPGTTPTP